MICYIMRSDLYACFNCYICYDLLYNAFGYVQIRLDNICSNNMLILCVYIITVNKCTINEFAPFIIVNFHHLSVLL